MENNAKTNTIYKDISIGDLRICLTPDTED
jgi:hypothetical protein